MSVFKRLGNVARGKMLELGRVGPPDRGEPDELDPDRPPPSWRASRAPAGEGATSDSPRELLERLKAEGLLTDAEYAEKLARLDAPPAPATPRKRTL